MWLACLGGMPLRGVGATGVIRVAMRWYAARANSHKVEVPGASHAVYVSRPKEVAALIEAASQVK
jgi:pimeloyl-ACP methyl ester carboxylesterase